jgi:hypothetical protein
MKATKRIASLAEDVKKATGLGIEVNILHSKSNIGAFENDPHVLKNAFSQERLVVETEIKLFR